MHGKPLSSIPERNESEEELKTTKWVPKKKHEVLKAKYKCLKKLFQIYDASVVGMLPDGYAEADEYKELNPEPARHRRRRSHRTKTDASCTTDASTGDVTDNEEKSTITTAVIRDLTSPTCRGSQSVSIDTATKDDTHSSKDTLTEKECESTQTCTCDDTNQMPYIVLNEKRRMSRFQGFLQRLFGLKPEEEKKYRSYMLPSGHIYSESDNNINHLYGGRRRRRLRFRKTRRLKKISSEMTMRDVKSPMILSYVQNVQKNCLNDTTPRQCPFVGCKSMFYGIINYNDHLNLCHFVNRKFVCHYCHEGFENDYEKSMHENEHIGISKLNLSNMSVSTTRHAVQRASDTQTEPQTTLDVPDEKLKKIVSFFDKIVDSEQSMSEIGRKIRYSESNLQGTLKLPKPDPDTMSSSTPSSARRPAASCGDLLRAAPPSDVTSKRSSPSCQCKVCGENFDYRRQLSLHVELEHGAHDKFSKFHSCPGLDARHHSQEGLLRLNSRMDGRRTPSTLTQDSFQSTNSSILSSQLSTNIIYDESSHTLEKKPTTISSFVQKMRSGITNYKWEPSTKIIRV